MQSVNFSVQHPHKKVSVIYFFCLGYKFFIASTLLRSFVATICATGMSTGDFGIFLIVCLLHSNAVIQHSQCSAIKYTRDLCWNSQQWLHIQQPRVTFVVVIVFISEFDRLFLHNRPMSSMTYTYAIKTLIILLILTKRHDFKWVRIYCVFID